MTEKSNLTWHGVYHSAILNERDKGRIGNEMFILAQGCADVKSFLKECRETEHYYAQPERGQDHTPGSPPSAWTQAKSDIKQGWMLGEDPTLYETLSSFRKAKGAANQGKSTIHFRKGGGGKPAAEAEDKANAEATKEAEIAKAVADVPVVAAVPAAPAAEASKVLSDDDKTRAQILSDLERVVKLLMRLPDTARKSCIRDVTALVQRQHDGHYQAVKKAQESQKSAQKAA